MRVLLLALLLCALSRPVDAADTHFLMFGDSITIGHGDGSIRCPDNASVGGYPPRLRSELVARGLSPVVTNHGVCGERTSAGVTRIDSVLEGGGDVIVIMEGTNDVSGRVGFECILHNINEMTRKAQNAGVEPVLASIIPRGPESGPDSSNGKTYNIERRLRIDAEMNGWSYADPFHALWDLDDFFELYYLDQLHPNPVGYSLVANSMVDAAVEAATSKRLCSQLPPGPCTASDTALCLNQGRFRLETKWKNFFGQEGVGRAVPETDDTGSFFWFDSQNIEMGIKVLDGRQENEHFWVFYGALTNVEFSLAVKDTETGRCKEYFNPLGTFASVGDTEAFYEPLP